MRGQRGSVMGELTQSVLIAVVLALVIRMFLFHPFFIPSGSMEPTLMVGDRIIVNKFVYRFKQPERGDVIVFKYPLDPQRDFIKRVIGLSGEKVEIRSDHLLINDKMVPEPYLPKGLQFDNFGPVKVPEDNLLVLGDNRNSSQDSRVWGALPKKNIIGKAFVIFWPLKRIGLIH
ncbi:MAG: signal peptidase I [Bacillota bacterium]